MTKSYMEKNDCRGMLANSWDGEKPKYEGDGPGDAFLGTKVAVERKHDDEKGDW